jgi:tetratricopeptide (TPR) repeat protein
MDKKSNKYRTLCIYLALVLTTLASYWQVRNCNFVSYDDNLYVTDNLYVQRGLTGEGIIWAFTTDYAANWHPLTWLSHMLDCSLFGTNPRWHHFTNLLLHIANTLLLFAVLKRMTAALWRSAFVAALFALHPLHVESVAWIAERKDVLSTLFWLLTMIAYLSYVRHPGIIRYLLTVVVFALGLMAKPMLVTLPFVLLLLDCWPLGRLRFSGDVNHKSLFRLVREKVPFFVLSAISSVITFIVQQKSGAMSRLDWIPLIIRFGNAFVSYVKYIGKMFWPSRLAVLYPYPVDMALLWPAVSALVLLAVSVFVIRFAPKYRYLLLGWLWYLGTLFPVIGLVQVGGQSLADRYTYVPLIGLFIIIAWGLPDLLAKWQRRKIMLGISAGIVLVAMSVCTRLQVSHWRNSKSLFEHALNVTAGNYVAHCSLAYALQQQGELDQAITHNRQALRINPNYPKAHLGLGLVLLEKGNLTEAVAHFNEALRINPDFADAHYHLARALSEENKINEAVTHLREALRLRADWVGPMNNLAWFLATHKNSDFYDPQEAVRLAERTCELTRYNQPDLLDTLAAAYAAAGRFSDAVATAEKALELALFSQQSRLIEQIQNRLSLYRASRAYIESSTVASPVDSALDHP